MSSNATALGFLRNDDLGKLILRVSIGGKMLLHGIFKLQKGLGDIENLLQGKGLPTMMAYGAYVGEILAPILIIIGLFTRPAAAVVAFTMVLAVYLAHSKDVFSRGPQGGWAIELPMLFMFGAVALVFFGSGKYSVSRGKGMLD